MEGVHEPLIRVMALHALAYCERLFYLEEVEEIRVADAAVYGGRTLHEELKRDEEEDGVWSSRELASESLGLVGKVDCLRKRDGVIIPYEHKKGRARRSGKTAVPWPADALQVSAYGMLLEDETGSVIPEGRVRYHADNISVRVPLDGEARRSVEAAVARARELRTSTERPPVAPRDSSCIRCSLAPVCLPEEERLAADPGWEPVRLFPADHEMKTIHVITPGARVGRSGDSLRIQTEEGDPQEYPMREVEAVVLHGYPQMTTQALHLCAANGVGVHFVSASGRYVAGVTPPGRVQRHLRQFEALSQASTCLVLSRKVVITKVENQLRYLLRATRETDRSAVGIKEAIEALRESLKQSARAEDLGALRGHEGSAARGYFGAMDSLLAQGVPAEMRFDGRNRRPPKDRFNAALSFGYALLYQATLQAITVVGLEPSLGFFHTARSSAHPLVLDLMELFRVPLWDVVLIGSINRMQWSISDDFTATAGRVWLSESGRRKAIQLFEKRLEETWKHPVIGYSLSYARLIELEVRLLEKEWAGQPGLFARMRLR